MLLSKQNRPEVFVIFFLGTEVEVLSLKHNIDIKSYVNHTDRKGHGRSTILITLLFMTGGLRGIKKNKGKNQYKYLNK